MEMTRQQKRNEQRRADKPEPAPIDRTSRRHIRRSKGLPFSRMKLDSITPASNGNPAVFNVSGYTTNNAQSIKATLQNIDWFVRGLTPQMKLGMIGR